MNKKERWDYFGTLGEFRSFMAHNLYYSLVRDQPFLGASVLITGTKFQWCTGDNCC